MSKKIVDENNKNFDKTNVQINNKKTGGTTILFSIIFLLIVVAGVIVCYFALIKNNDEKKDKNPTNNSSKNSNDNKDPVKTYNNLINYDVLRSKVSNSKTNTITKCDCSKVTSETDVDNAVCTSYTMSNESALTIVNKLSSTKDAEELPTSILCSTYSFKSLDENDKTIIFGFASQDLKSILVGYKDNGYAFDYNRDLTAFFEEIISNSKKIETKKEESTELSKDEISALINRIEKYNLLDLRNTDKKVIVSNNVTHEMLDAMYSYVASLDDSFSEHWDESTWSFKRDKADEYFNKAFGFIPKEYFDLVCPVDDEPLLIYDKVAGTFTYNDEHPGHGGPIGGFIDYNVTGSQKKDNIYTIDVLFLRGNEADGYYINDEEFNINIEYDSEEGPKIYKQEFKKIDPLKYPKYSFEFEKVKDNYILKSITYKK